MLFGDHQTPIQGPLRPYGGASATGLTNLLNEVSASTQNTACDLSTPVYFNSTGGLPPPSFSFIPSP